MWRIGVLMIIAENEPEAQTDLRAFRQGLGRLGWEEGKNINVNYRWAAGDTNRLRADAAQLVNLTDLIGRRLCTAHTRSGHHSSSAVAKSVLSTSKTPI